MNEILVLEDIMQNALREPKGDRFTLFAKPGFVVGESIYDLIFHYIPGVPILKLREEAEAIRKKGQHNIVYLDGTETSENQEQGINRTEEKETRQRDTASEFLAIPFYNSLIPDPTGRLIGDMFTVYEATGENVVLFATRYEGKKKVEEGRRTKIEEGKFFQFIDLRDNAYFGDGKRLMIGEKLVPIKSLEKVKGYKETRREDLLGQFREPDRMDRQIQWWQKAIDRKYKQNE